jgi:hypothetical protein
MNDDTTTDRLDYYDRMMGSLTMRGDVTKTTPVLRRSTSILGTTETFNVQTIRSERADSKPRKDGSTPMGDTIFIEYTSAQGLARYVIPPVVAEVIVQQRGMLDAKARKAAARKAVETRRAKKGASK